MIRYLNEINKVIKDLKSRNYNEALKKLKKVIIVDSNRYLICKIFASIYFQKKEWMSSIKYYEQMLFFEIEVFRIYNSIGVALFNLGKINESIGAYKKAIKENLNFDLAYNNLGISYSELGAHVKAVKSFVHALNLNSNNQNAKNNLINTFFVAKTDNINGHLLVEINNKIKNISNKVNNSIKSEDIKNILNESEHIIKDSLKEINFNETQIFRRNSENLNCKRHFKVFNEFNIIPKYCFSCYKVQINVINVYDLIKLYFVFDNLLLKRNNIRKCITEIRQNIPGNYKGYIYCDGVDEAKKIFDKISDILNKNKFNNFKVTIKHGCSEFYESYPDYQKINFTGNQPMIYDKNWGKKEFNFDNSIPIRAEIDKKQIHKSLKGINLSDILIMKNWICYATTIGDFSYKKIYNKEINSDFIYNILKPQLVFRKKTLLEQENN